MTAFSLFMCLAAAGRVSADTITWNNPAGGDWATATNWSPMQVPTIDDIAVIDGVGTYVVEVGASGPTSGNLSGLVMDNPNGTLRLLPGSSLAMHAGTGFENRGTIELVTDNQPQSFYLQGVLTNAPGAIFRTMGGGSGSVTVTCDLDNRGMMEIGSQFTLQQSSGGAVHRNSGTLSIAAGSRMEIRSGVWLQTSEGQTSIAEGAVVYFPAAGEQRYWTHQGGSVTGMGTIESNDVLNLNLEADLSIDGLEIDAFRLTVNGPGRFIVPAGPALFLNTWTINADFEYDRDLLSHGARINGAFGVPAGRTVHIGNTNLFGGGVNLTVAGGFENRGTIELGGDASSNGAALVVTAGVLTNAVGGIIHVLEGEQGSSAITAELDNRGTLEVARDVVVSKGAGVKYRNSGLIEVLAGKLDVYNFYGGNSLLNEGEIRVMSGGIIEPSGGALTNAISGLLSGSGEFRLGGVPTILNEGSVAPGLSPSTLTATGKYPQAASGILNLEIGGFTPDTEHDVLAVSETSPGAGALATLDGTVRATLINDFFPKKDDAFTVLTYASRTGEFATIESTEPERIAWKMEYGATSAQLVVLNTAPTLALIDDQTVNEQTQLSVTASATDQDLPAQTMTYSLDEAPDGMTINPATGQITWTPTEAQGPGEYAVTVRVVDNGTPVLGHSTSFSVTVNEVNVAPQLALPGAQSGDELAELVFIVNGTDADLPANALTYEMLSGPEGAAFDPATREFRWTPTEIQGPGSFAATFRVTDNNPDAVNDKQLSAEGMVNITVNEVNLPPALAGIDDQSVDEETLLTLTATAADPDLPANGLTYSLEVAPSGMTIDPATGEITWTPTEAQGPGDHEVTVRVTDNGAPPLGHTTSLTVTVNEVNLAPTMTMVANAVVHAGTPFSTLLSATDPDEPENSFTYSLVAGPAGATVGPEGLVDWTPALAAAGSLADFTVRVTDNGSPAQTDDHSFQVTVTDALGISAFVQTDNELELIWSAIPGRTYRLVTSGTLPAIEWSPVPGDVPATGGTASKTVIIDTGAAFFQVELVD